MLAAMAMAWATAHAGVEVEGNGYFRENRLLSFLDLPANWSDLDSAALGRWVGTARDEIHYQYQNAGYFQARVDGSVWKNTSESPFEWEILLKIKEGPRYRFGRVKIETMDGSGPLLGPEDLRSQSGRTFHADLVAQDKRDLEKTYGDRGYAKRVVRQMVSLRDSLRLCDVVFRVDPRHLVIFDTLIVRNRAVSSRESHQGMSNSALIRGILNFNRGDTVRLSKTNLYKDKLKSTRVFRSVRLQDSLVSESPHRSVLILRLEERTPGSLNSALFWETQDGFGAEGAIAYRNILGRFYQGKFLTRLAQRRQHLSMGLANPLLFGTRIRIDNDLDLIWRQDPELGESVFNAIASSTFSRPLFGWFRYFAELEFESTVRKRRSGESRIDQSRVINMNLIQSLWFEAVDNTFNPTLGAKALVNYGNGGPVATPRDNFAAFAAMRYNWLEGKTAYYFPLWRIHVAAFRLDAGRFFGDGETNSRRFFLGGRTSVRNAAFRELCPEKVTVTLTDGTELRICTDDVEPVYLLGSFELRLKVLATIGGPRKGFRGILRKLQFVPFTDIGRIWDADSPLRAEGRGEAVGLGLRLPLTVFNFRFDYAAGWDDGPQFGDSRFLFDLAHAF